VVLRGQEESSAPREKSAADADSQAQSERFDPAIVSQGQSAFESSCTACHDAQRSLGKSKSYAGWLATVQRMAGKDDADIRASDHVPIATYLASRSAATASGAAAEGAGGWSFGATISTLHRSASDESLVEYPGFFPDVWVSASYQSNSPWRASITACTSCHSGNNSNLELVEGSVTFDLRHFYNHGPCDDGREVLLKAGRFPVPFGAFAAISHPGIYRTVTNPLMFNMGRRVFVPGSSPPLQPVLPMPFADEGVDLMLRLPLTEELALALDLYAVNGLQSNSPNIFLRSRAYYDNNEAPSTGARLTLGNRMFKLGTSILAGNLEEPDVPAAYYTLAGADATVKLGDRFRFYTEYAMRRQDSPFMPGLEDNTYGIVAEAELMLWEKPYIGLLSRYDTLEHRDPTFGNASLERITTGLNIGMPLGSLLMINHERWMPGSGEDVDLFALRWVVSL
jgi:hypothetical protein